MKFRKLEGECFEPEESVLKLVSKHSGECFETRFKTLRVF